MINKEFIRISRPRFWIYTLGPFLIGIAASDILWTIRDFSAMMHFGGYILLMFLLFELISYFSYGANLLIYGVNDLADEDTDQYNDKKQGYEHVLEQAVEKRTKLKHRIITTQILFFITISALVVIINLSSTIPYFSIDYPVLIGVRLLFLFFAYFYSSSPIRAKSKPFLDGLFNIIYVLPGLFTYITFGGDLASVNRPAFAAGWLRCIAMHTFSAIPDIEPDRKAFLATTAVYFGEKDTLLYCGGIWLWAARLAGFSIPTLKWFFYPAAGVYLLMLALCLHYPVLSVYKKFPRVNGLIGFLLFWALSFNGILR